MSRRLGERHAHSMPGFSAKHFKTLPSDTIPDRMCSEIRKIPLLGQRPGGV